MAIRAQWTDADRFLRYLSGQRRRSIETSELMRRVGLYLRSSTVGRIRRGQLGTENSAATKAVKRGSRPLMDRGTFVQGITYRWGRSFAAVGSNARQARILQHGGTIQARRAEKLAFPAGPRTRRLQRRYGFDIRTMLSEMRADGWNVWFMENAIMAQEEGGKAFPLFVRKDEVTIPAYRPFRLTRENARDSERIAIAWLNQ